MMKEILVVILFALAYASQVQSADQTAESCSVAHITTAITNLGGSGTVTIPAGDCTWASGVTINGLGVSVSLIGSGSSTIIRPSFASSSTYAFQIGTAENAAPAFVRISNFNVETTASNSHMVYATWAQSLRIDHLYVVKPSGNPQVVTKNVAKVLIDNNYFEQNNVTGDGCYAGYLLESGSLYTPTRPSDVANYCYSGASGCACEVGSGPHYRSSSIAAGNTVIARLDKTADASANINNSGGSGTGQVRKVHLYIASVAASPTVDLASFTASGNVMTTRDSASGITVHQGLNILTAGVDFTAFDISDGDFIGVSLNNCTLASGATVPSGEGGTTANSHWIASGDQVPATNADFGTSQTGNVSLWASIYDTEGILETCETTWEAWWENTSTQRVSSLEGYNRAYADDYKPSSLDDQGWFIEDNVFRWVQATFEGNWDTIQKVTIRHNEFFSPAESCTSVSSQPTTKPGGMFLHQHDNVFNNYSFTRSDISFEAGSKHIHMVGGTNGYVDFRHMFEVNDLIDITGSANNNGTVTVAAVSKTQITTTESLTDESAGATVNLLKDGVTLSGGPTNYFYQINGLVYNNTINNRSVAWMLDCIREYDSLTLPPLINQKHLHIFDNTSNNVTCGDPDAVACMAWEEARRDNAFCSYNGTYFFRAPESGETLYGWTAYTYPHPLRGEETPPAGGGDGSTTLGSGGTMTLGSGGTITIQ